MTTSGASTRAAERIWRARKDSRILDARLLVDPSDDPSSAGNVRENGSWHLASGWAPGADL